MNIQHTKHPVRAAAILLGLALALTGPASLAAEGAASGDGDAWEFEITPYLLAAGLDGRAGLRGVSTDIDMSSSEVLDNLDSAFMALFTARKGRWSYGLESVYFKMSDEGSRSVSGPFGKVTVDGALELTTSMNVYQGSIGYRVSDQSTLVDLIGAVRYTQVDVDMSVELSTVPGIVFPPNSSLDADGSESWTDVVIGVRVLHPVSDNVSLLGYADVGAGDSDQTYQLIAGVNWEFAKDLTAKAGYRIIDWDYENDGTVWDMQASGGYLGLGFKF